MADSVLPDLDERGHFGNSRNLMHLTRLFFARLLISLVLAWGVWFFRGALLAGPSGMLWDPMPGLVIGLAWRGWLAGAVAAAFVPLAGGLLGGGPEVGALLVEGGLAWLIAASARQLSSPHLRALLVIPLAAGVTFAGALVEQILSFNIPFGPGFGVSWTLQSLGVMAVAPLVQALDGDFLSRMDSRIFLGWVLLSILLLVVGRVAALPDIDPQAGLALALIPLVILFWQAMRFGVPGSATACFLVALSAGMAWAEGNAGMLSFSPGLVALGLTAALGMAHGMAAIRDEREDTFSWVATAARNHQVVFWRWRKGHGVEWDDPALAGKIGLISSHTGWTQGRDWQTENSLPDPGTTFEPVLVRMRDPVGQVRWLELAGDTQARDPSGQVSVVLGTAMEVTERQLSQERRETLLRRETELRTIRSQLHPHVIFNALNRIAALTMSEPEKARDLLVRLSRLLRATLIAGEKTSTRLEEEMGLIRDYLELEGAGLGERLRFQDRIPAGSDGSTFPPLLLFSLIEGAVRRGVGMRKEGATITLSRPRPGCFRVEVDPPVPGGEAEFPEWPDPVWRERVGMQQSRRDTLRVESEKDGSVRAVEVELREGTK
jgi:hypothetical protein